LRFLDEMNPHKMRARECYYVKIHRHNCSQRKQVTEEHAVTSTQSSTVDNTVLWSEVRAP
jgi:hypothetical protein